MQRRLDGFKIVSDLCEVVINHAWNLLDQCYSAVLCANQTLQLSDLIVSLRVLIFNIKDLQSIAKSFLGLLRQHQKRVNNYMNEFERLQLDFEDTKSEKDVLALRRQKILVFCQQLRLSFAEAQFITIAFPHCPWVLFYHKQLVKNRKRVLALICEKKEWSKKYLRRVRKYKRCAFQISTSVNGYRHYRNTQDHVKFVQDHGISDDCFHRHDLW